MYYSSSSVQPTLWEARLQMQSSDCMGPKALCTSPEKGSVVVSLRTLSVYVAYTCPLAGQWETTLPYYHFCGSVSQMQAGTQSLFAPAALLQAGLDWWYVYTTHLYPMIQLWESQGWEVILED